MNLAEFKAGLVKITGEPSTMRPFVCEGSPLDCEVFIVGYNPATEMQGDWWQFWKPDYGFQKSLWKQALLNQRGTASKTRERIEAIVVGLSPLIVLEANIDARPSMRKSKYRKPDTKPFDYLLRSCTPKVVIAHGVDAVAYLQNWKGGRVIKSKHFIFVGEKCTAQIIADTLSACNPIAVTKNRVIVEVGTEGGSIALLGTPTERGWKFVRKVNDGTPELLDEQPIHTQSTSVDAWGTALELLDRYPWTRLFPLLVDPDFKREIWNAVKERLMKEGRNASQGQLEYELERWRAVCGITDRPE